MAVPGVGSQGPSSLCVKEVLDSTKEYFERHGIESARLNAELLLAHILGKKNRIDLYLEFDRPLGPKELNPMRDWMRRRVRGEPLQHLIGTVEFHGREFAVDRRALIPRPETEQLLELILKLDLPVEARCLDVGVGSGVIALTLAAELPSARVEAVDRSLEALALTRDNAAKLGLSHRLTLVHGDLLASSAGPYDLIVANLPYIPSAEIVRLAREVQHDPVAALDGGADGLELIARCILEAPAKLAAGGRLALEIGHDQAERVRQLLAEGGFHAMAAFKDYEGVERFFLAVRGD